jgi:hypothetical protein
MNLRGNYKYFDSTVSLNWLLRILINSMKYFMVVSFFAGCKSSNVITPSDSNVSWDLCVPVNDSNYKARYSIDLVPDSTLKSEMKQPVLFHERDMLIANASGTLLFLKNLTFATSDRDSGDSSFMECISRLKDGLNSIRSQAEGILSELECEAFRTRQLYIQLRNLNSNKNTRLTAESIVIGSATNITPVIITEKTPQNITIVSGSLLSAGLSLHTLSSGDLKMKLIFYRNLLSDIWFAPVKSVDYPAGLWYILNNRNFSNTRQLSKIQLIKMRWLKFELDNSVNKTTENLFFGTGGIFDQDELELRVSMLSELMAEVNTINVDLDNFEYDLDHLKRKSN